MKKRFVSSGPKKPQTQFLLFTADMRKILPKMSIGEFGKKVGEMWRELDETEKMKYQERYMVAHAEYEKEMELFKQTPQYEAEKVAKAKFLQSIKEENKKEGINSRKKRSEPKEKKVSAYNIFVQEFTREAKANGQDCKLSTITKEISAKWKEMDSDQKKEYVEKADESNKNKTKKVAALSEEMKKD